jgi:hypothetical protein
MAAVEWNKKEELVAEQALKHIKVIFFSHIRITKLLNYELKLNIFVFRTMHLFLEHSAQHPKLN